MLQKVIKEFNLGTIALFIICLVSQEDVMKVRRDLFTSPRKRRKKTSSQSSVRESPDKSRLAFVLNFFDFKYECRRVTGRSAPLLRHCYRCRRSGVRILGRSNRTQCCQRLATIVAFLRSGAAHALSNGDGPRHSFYVSAL